MDIFLLANGCSDRLHPLTDDVPTPLLPLVNRPVILHVIETLARQGCKQMTISLYHQPGSIESYLGPGRRWGVSLQYVLQREPWGTAAAVKAAESLLGDTILVMPADSLVAVDVAALLDAHRRRGSVATAVVHQSQLTTPSGDPPAVPNTGVYLLEAAALAHIPPNAPCELATDLLPALRQQNLPVHVCVSGGYWNPLDSFAAYRQANVDLLAENGQERPSWLDDSAHRPGIWVGKHSVIHPSVRVAAPVVIGRNCFVGRDVELGPGVVLGDNVVVDDAATVSESIVTDHTYVGRLVQLNGRFVHKNLVVDLHSGHSVRVTDDFLLGETHATVAEAGLRRLFDVTIALALLLLLGWLLLPISVGLWLSQGRVLQVVPHVHARPAPSANSSAPTYVINLLRLATVGRNGRSSRLGRWLQAVRLTRLPELWNVLCGDLSLVGVKPLTPTEAAQITQHWQQKRYESRPGFTGLWFINGAANGDLDTILIADVYYTVTQSWQSDFSILGKTLLGWWQCARQSGNHSR